MVAKKSKMVPAADLEGMAELYDDASSRLRDRDHEVRQWAVDVAVRAFGSIKEPAEIVNAATAFYDFVSKLNGTKS